MFSGKKTREMFRVIWKAGIFVLALTFIGSGTAWPRSSNQEHGTVNTLSPRGFLDHCDGVVYLRTNSTRPRSVR